MAHVTKAQAKRLLNAIDSKAKRLWSGQATASGPHAMTTNDMIAIEKIVARSMKRLG